MQKTPECPEDCREAISSLMFAASGFSELPELRELRQMFHEKYTDSLALFVNQELVENMSSKPFSMEKKVKLMEDVALEFSIRWDSKDFEKRIVRQNSISVMETPKSTNDKYKPVDRNMALPKREEFEGSENGVSLNRKTAEASERRDPLFQSDKESYQNGLRGNQRGLTYKERSENVLHASRSESKDNKAERKEFYLHSKQNPAREKHQPIFNEGDTIVMKVNYGNLGQGNGHRPGVVDAHKKTEFVASERKEFYSQSKQEPSRERHQPIFNDGDTIVMKVKHENHVQGNGHKNGVVDLHKKIEVNASEKLKSSSSKRADKLVIGFKQESFFQGYKHEKNEEHAHQKVEDSTSRPPKPNSKSKRAESINPGSRHHNDRESKENAVLVGKSTEEDPSGDNVKGGEYEYDHANPARKVEERETERMKSPFYKSLPPPYVKKSIAKARHEKAEALDNPKARFDGEEGNHPDNGKNVYGAERRNGAGHHEVNDIDNASLKRQTNRRKHIVESGGDDHISSRRRENSRKGLQVLIDEDEKDSEEKMMDKLLMHYSKKPSSYEKDNVQEESKSRRTHLKKGESDEEMMIHQPARSRSLPAEQLAGPSEPAKTFARAASFQPERSSEAKHVHPKLPNYDDLAARFAELKGR
ncbi:Regulator of Vps4 activity in the MVB pathway protein [Arabidopsis thaliana]|jgi:acyl-CoA-binding protein|nr:Regulator of Vps4 activity in the MVB pathway protein [Arabidopsis thaliana]ANM66511.1 Regulator of Vps4 activity in the MVB pathway protein [Arabidopsis thaliana]|eukprot:NP_001328402.1 Regulator of Vps4 activity in the MVB pathway protein [Arabidopsis thaliana]